jgi:arylsulfatase A-like enzyme
MQGEDNTKSDFYRTPALESFAKEGMVFSNAYAPAPVCTPSRNSMLHGMTPANMLNSVLHADQSIKNYRGVITIPQALKKADENYITAHFGKWHIPCITPKKAGYDVTDGPTGNGEGDYEDDMKTPLSEKDPKRMVELTDKTINFMTEQVKSDKPFFVQLSHYAVHIWHDSSKETREKYRKLPRGKKAMDSDYLPESEISEGAYKHNWLINYAAMIDDMDVQFDRLLKSINTLGIKENTYVIFTSDNGGGLRGNEPLQGAKCDLTEGGIRIPFIVRGPQVPKNTYCNKTTVGWDLLPTLYDLAGGKSKLPDAIEGGSLKSVLSKGDDGKITRNLSEIIFHFPWYNGEPESAMIIGNMKILKNLDTKKVQLFDISKDYSELNDLAGQMPERVAAMEKRLTDYLKEVEAEDVTTLRQGYLERITQTWRPYEAKKLAALKVKLANGDDSVKKEVDRITGYIKFLDNEVAHSIKRSKMHGVNFEKFSQGK